MPDALGERYTPRRVMTARHSYLGSGLKLAEPAGSNPVSSLEGVKKGQQLVIGPVMPCLFLVFRSVVLYFIVF